MPSGIKGSNKKYNCLHCHKENKWGWSKTNKFCNNTCQGEYKWVTDTVPRIERGDCGGPSSLKRYLIEKFGEKCAECGLGAVWQNKPLVLQLEHADGNSDNNMPQNLKLLCPNCHTQSEFFGSKGHGSRYKKITKRNKYLQDYKKREVA